MKPIVIAVTAAFWAASSLSGAVAQQASPSAKLDPNVQQPEAKDPPQASVGPTRPMESTPQKFDLPPERLEYVQRAQEELESFREEIETHRAQLPANHQGTEVDDMMREWHRLKEKWHWLSQTRGENWETAREQFERLYSDIRDEWQEVRRQG